MYKVNMSATLEEQSIHVEKSSSSGEPGSLAYGVEGEDPLSVAQLAWKFLRTHPAQSFHLQLPPGLPPKRRGKISHAAVWLVRQIVQDRSRAKAKAAVKA